MQKQVELVLLPEEAADQSRQLQLAAQGLSIKQSRIKALRIVKRSIDGRSKQVKIRLIVDVFVDEEAPVSRTPGFVPDTYLCLVQISDSAIYTYAHVVILKKRETSRIIRAFLEVVG